jgi:hypothetical protein
MTNPERAAEHAAEAERLLAESEKHSRQQITRMNLFATQAVVHANLAIFYALADQARRT